METVHPMYRRTESEMRKRIKELESHIREFIGIDVDEWEEYELKHLMKRYVEDFRKLLKRG